MHGGDSGIHLGDLDDIPRRTRESSAFVEVETTDDSEGMKDKFHQYLWRWHMAEDGGGTDNKGTGRSSKSSLNREPTDQIQPFKRQQSIMDKMFKRPTIGQTMDIEFDHKSQESKNRNSRWAEHKEKTQFLLSSDDTDTDWGCACVINPDNFLRQMWDIVAVTICLIYTAVRVPYAIAFDIGLYSLTLSAMMTLTFFD